jgi:hypothetical protein
MILAPDTTLKLDCYADADFAGLYGYEDAQDSSCVKSRTGYVCTLGEVPILWASKLQTEIALSTLEAEYIALSQAMRDLLPLRDLMTVISSSLQLDRDDKTMVSTVWEDNNGALGLAKKEAPLMTPWTKHIAIKYHWFRSKIHSNSIDIEPIDTVVQKADIFTKGLRQTDFEAKRRLLIGW